MSLIHLEGTTTPGLVSDKERPKISSWHPLRDGLVLLGLGLAVMAWAALVLGWGQLETPVSHVRGSDWDYQLTLLEACGRLWSEGILPAWNPWTAGGVPLLANPEAPVFHPMAFAAMHAHPASVARVILIVHMGIQAVGTAALARWLGASRLAMLVVGAGLISTDVLVWRMAHGHLMMAQAAWIPVALVVALGLRSSLRAGALAGVAVAIAAHGGGHYPAWIGLASTGLGVVALGLTRGLPVKQVVVRLVTLATTAGLLIAPRWIPTAVGLADSHRLRGAQAPRAMGDFSMTDALVSIFAAGEWSGLPRVTGLHEGLPVWSTPLFGLLAVLGVVLGLRTRMRPQVMAVGGLSVVAVWVSLGHNAPINLFGLLHAVPPLDRFRNPERWAMTWVPLWVALSAVGVTEAVRGASKRWMQGAGLGGTALLLVGHLTLAHPQVLAHADFDQVTTDTYYRTPMDGPPDAIGITEHWTSNFEATGHHTSCLPCSDALLHEAPPELAEGPYALSPPAELLTWSPLEVGFVVPLDPDADPRRPQSRLVVVPQAFHRGWHAVDSVGDSLEVKAHPAGTAVVVPVPDRSVRLWFEPPGWALGRGLGLLGVALLVSIFVAGRRVTETE